VDTLGRDFRTGLDVNDNGLVLDSNDRIVEKSETFGTGDGESGWWATTTEWNFPYTTATAPSGANAGTPVRARTVHKRLTGLTASVRGETITRDAEGNETRATIIVDATNKVVTTTTTRTGMANGQVEVRERATITSFS
jgi:hypothetical protein